jgi:hypothetical protein
MISIWFCFAPKAPGVIPNCFHVAGGKMLFNFVLQKRDAAIHTLSLASAAFGNRARLDGQKAVKMCGSPRR